jgi:hypothetical protein
MTALENASQFLAELDKRHVQYFLQIVRPEAFMVSVAIPGERWEIEFFDDGHVELERFETRGVNDYNYTVEEVLNYFGQRLFGEPEGDGPSAG